MGNVTKLPVRHEFPPQIETGLVNGYRGKPVWCAENACLIMELHPAWRGALAYDEFNDKIMLRRPIPGSDETVTKPRALEEADITQAVRWFNRNGFPDASKSVTGDAIVSTARQNRMNPVKQYLNSLSWDGTPRIDRWLTTYCSAEDRQLVQAMGRKWLIAAVARTMNPGCKADCALVLEGTQGAGKSTALRILASDQWFHDGLGDMHSKDASQALRGKWIIELAELSAMRRSDAEAVKAFLSRCEERYRPAYGKLEVHEPRRCVFAGSTNKSNWLNDDTGGRRFWPVKVGRIDTEALTRDRDQIWAEAVEAYESGEKWWLPRDLDAAAHTNVMQRSEDDPWEARVLEIAGGKPDVSTNDIFDGLGISMVDRDKATTMRIGGILTRNGWQRNGKYTSGPNKKTACYVNPMPRTDLAADGLGWDSL